MDPFLTAGALLYMKPGPTAPHSTAQHRTAQDPGFPQNEIFARQTHQKSNCGGTPFAHDTALDFK